MADFKKILINPKESVLSVLGNNYAQTFLATGSIGKGFAILSDKRVYFKGKCLYKTGKKYHSSNEERIVDLTDVTGSGFEHIVQNSALVWGIIVLILTLALVFWFNTLPISNIDTMRNWVLGIGLFFFAILLISYFANKRNLFKIDYAGGSIAFDLRFISKSEAETFNKALRNAKDNIKQ